MPDRLRFGRFELLLNERQLLDDSRPVVLGARAFDLLVVLIERRDRLVTKNELLDLVWPGLVVEEANLPVQMSALRKVIGAQAVATIPGRGYRFAMSLDDGQAAPAAGITQPAMPAPRTNVPAALEVLLGRDEDVEALPRWLAEHRLVTVLGAGGIGKTQLAQAAARASLGAYADGVWWVDLAAVSSAEKIAPGIANAAHLQLGDGAGGDEQTLAQLVRALASRQTLLVLDNCEHLAREVAIVVHAVLCGAARVRVLATSQEALKVAGEHLYCLSPLAVPPHGVSLATARGFAAVELLERRARAADPRFGLTEATVGQAIDLCQQLGGVALAIEMAAARLPLLGLGGLCERLGDRLSLLRASSRGAPSRQKTLRATLDWSHELLDADERAVLRRLAVFAGSFRLDAAQHTAALAGLDAGAVLDALAGLVDKSLVKLEQIEPPRYRLAETTRLYVWERLRDAGEAEAALRSHGEAMARVARVAHGHGLPESELLRDCVLDYDDIAEAFDRAVERKDADVAATTVRILRKLDQFRGELSNTRRRVQGASAMLPLASSLGRAHLCSFIVSCGWIGVGDATRVDIAREAVRLWRDADDLCELHHALSRLATELARHGEFAEAESALGDALQIEDPSWPPDVRAIRVFHASTVANFRGDAQRYREHVRQALNLFEQAGSRRMAAMARDGLACAALMAGDIDESIAISRVAVAELRALDQPTYLGLALGTLCKGLLMARDLDGARTTAAQALPLLDQDDTIGLLVNELALLAALEGRSTTAALLLGYADAWHRENQSPRFVNTLRTVAAAAAALDAALGPEEHERLRTAGAQLSNSRAVGVARELLAEGQAAREALQAIASAP